MEDTLPSYEQASTVPEAGVTGGGEGVGQLIDLGSDIMAPPPAAQGERSDDIVTQLAQLGITTEPAATVEGGTANPAPSGGGQTNGDEFDMFAESRTAYGTQQQR